MKSKFVVKSVCERWLSAATMTMLLTVIYTLPVVAQQEAWVTKNVDQWTSADIDTVLNSSAWVMNKVVRLPSRTDQAAQTEGADAAQEKDSSLERNTPGTLVDFNFILRLRSALPIRIALMRQLQLDSDY